MISSSSTVAWNDDLGDSARCEGTDRSWAESSERGSTPTPQKTSENPLPHIAGCLQECKHVSFCTSFLTPTINLRSVTMVWKRVSSKHPDGRSGYVGPPQQRISTDFWHLCVHLWKHVAIHTKNLQVCNKSYYIIYKSANLNSIKVHVTTYTTIHI